MRTDTEIPISPIAGNKLITFPFTFDSSNQWPLPFAELQNQSEKKWLDWFANHTTDWVDTRIHSSGIHSFLTNRSFNSLELTFLSNGLRFICTPPKTKTNFKIYEEQFLSDYNRGFKRYSRTLLQKIIFHDNKDDNYISKFKSLTTNRHSTEHYIDQQETQARETALGNDINFLERYQQLTLTLLTEVIRHPTTYSSMQYIKSNHSEHDRRFIKSILTDPTITIKPADKNLGLALVDTSWYDQELRKMLSDTSTYTCCTTMKNKNGKEITFDTNKLKKNLIEQFNSIIIHNKELIMDIFEQHGEQIVKYLESNMRFDFIKIPEIYLLIKVHKPKGLCGRPIVPCFRSVTTPASVLCDHMLHKIIKAARIPWLVKDTKSLICDIESDKQMNHDGKLITGDINSLYTNIHTETGIQLVKQFLIINNVSPIEIKLIIILLSFVMKNSYLSYKQVVYHQHNGTAMGTACAPPYATIVVYMLEKDFINKAISEGKLLNYRRFLDDIKGYIIPSFLEEFKTKLNQLHSSLTFEFEHDDKSISFLDLVIFKGQRFLSEGIFDTRVHQKKMNLYLYIPFTSFHPTAAKKSFIQTELMRYIRNNSSQEHYEQLKILFFFRLRDRGYPAMFLYPLFDSIYYSDRSWFLLEPDEFEERVKNIVIHNYSVSNKYNNNTLYPFKSQCLIRKYHRLKQNSSSSSTTSHPNVFVIPFSPLSSKIPIQNILTKYWEILSHGDITKTFKRPLIAYQSSPSIASTLVYKKPSTTPTTPSTTQTKLIKFFCKNQTTINSSAPPQSYKQ